MTATAASLSKTIGRYWWVIALRGALAITFGIFALAWPALTAAALVVLFGTYAFTDGVFAIVSSVRTRGQGPRRWAGHFEGLAGILAGVMAFVWPGVTVLALLYLVATWAVIAGVLKIRAALHLRRAIKGEWLFLLGGIASIVMGLLLVAWPGAGILTLVWLTGSYALLFGVLLIALALRLRRHAPTVEG